MAKELTAAELDANSLSGLDAEGAGLREAAEKAGAFGPGNMQEDTSAPQESEPRAPDTTDEAIKPEDKEHADNSDTGAEKQTIEERPRDEQGRFIKKDEVAGEHPADAKPEAALPDKGTGPSDKPGDSAYDKAKKEADRRDRSWKALEEEKTRERAAIAAEKAQIERERVQLQGQMAQRRAQQNGERPRDEFGNVIYSSREYAAEAKRLRSLALKGEVGPNGEDYADLSEKAETAAQYSAQREARDYQQQFEQHQTNLAIEAMKAEPELADANSPLAKEVQAVFERELELSQKHQRPSVFKMIPDGFALAVEVAKLRRQAASVSELEAKNKQLETEVQRLRDATSIGGSSPIKHSGPKKLEDMSIDEMSETLRRRAEAEDSMMARA